MIENLPSWVSQLFLLAFFVSIFLFFYANGKPKGIVSIILGFSLVQALLGVSGFYNNTSDLPPRFLLVLVPSLIFVVFGLLPRQRFWILKVRDLRWSSLLHTVRIPVEVVLLQLSVYHLVPDLMTFEGRNFDILFGISAPIMALLYSRKWVSVKVLLVWNYVGLCFVLFILINAVLSIESPIQQFAFDQPNIAVQYFPFILLPAAIVPLVIWTHIGDIIFLQNLK
jgi:hypothetical protein